MEKRTFTVTIMGNEITIVSRDGEEHVKKVASYVDGKMKEARDKSRAASTHSLALLTALNIADEYLKYQEEAGKRLHKIFKSIEELG